MMTDSDNLRSHTEDSGPSGAPHDNHGEAQQRHPIQVVAQRSGLTADVIRMWERRYQAVQPLRAGNNQRLYSDADIERLRLLRIATDAGRRISAVVDLPSDQLEALTREDARHRTLVSLAAPVTASGQPQTQSALLDDCLSAALALDPRRLEQALSRALLELGTIQFLGSLICPLLGQIGQGWREGRVRTCQEHLATAHIRSFLGQLLMHANTDAQGPNLVVCTPANQIHELGALMSALMGATGGWNVVYLGPSVPAEEIAYAVHQVQAQAVALSLNYPTDDGTLPQQLLELRRQLPARVPILVGGSAREGYASTLQVIDALQFADLLQFGQFLDRIRR